LKFTSIHNPYSLWSKPKLLRGRSGVAGGLPGGRPRKAGRDPGEWCQKIGENPVKNCLKCGLGILLATFPGKKVIHHF